VWYQTLSRGWVERITASSRVMLHDAVPGQSRSTSCLISCPCARALVAITMGRTTSVVDQRPASSFSIQTAEPGLKTHDRLIPIIRDEM
jgi:hypothetical protein